IPVYILNALYLGPLTLWTYWRWGRPLKPSKTGKVGAHAHDHQHYSNGGDHSTMDHSSMTHTAVNHDSTNASPTEPAKDGHNDMNHTKMDQEKANHSHMNHEGGMHEGMDHAHMHHMDVDRPMFATVTVAVCHCGSGCLLGDLIGEWIVFGTGARINGKEIWVEFLLVLVYCTHVKGVWSEDCDTSRKGRLSLLDLLRNWLIRVDGYIPASYIQEQATHGRRGLLVDDADWHVSRALDSFSHQLVAYQGRNQRALCLRHGLGEGAVTSSK
ncbi:10977_t:CDS:2, partial [Acaulospora colombiana]